MYGGTGWGCTFLGLNAKVMLRSCQGHMKVNLDKKIQQIAILCLPTWFIREQSLIYDYSWIIQGQAPFQKVSQVTLRYPRSTRVVIAPSDLLYFHLRINSLCNSPFARTKIECQKWPNIKVWKYALNCSIFSYDCVERGARVGVTLYWDGVQRSF